MSETYLLGRSEPEFRRLARQAALVEHETEELFCRAGVATGMRLLEIGSGAGDVAMLAGRLVGPGGSVTGIEGSPESVAIATGRAADGCDHVRFTVADLDTFEPEEIYDGLVGRFVLPYLTDPAGSLSRLAGHVRPGGIVAFLEFDVRCIACVPGAPLFGTVAGWIVAAYEERGVDPSLGSSLGEVFRNAGLPWPAMLSFQKVSCGPDGIIWYFSELVRTLMAQIVAHGIATADEIDIETLGRRLEEEAVLTRHTAFSPRWTGAWVHLP